jgi:uncharacterized protein with PQ loop repeat
LVDRVRAINTPTALRMSTWVLVIALLVFGAVGLRAATQRQDAVETVRSEGAPLVERTESLYAALADADAAASTAFLRFGLEPVELHRRYIADIATAARELAVVGQDHAWPDEARDALSTLNERLPVYTGDIDSARANNRLGLTVGAAYQRDASKVMQEQLLPAATTLYEAAARRLDDGHRSGSSTGIEIAVIVVAAIVVALLVVVQVFLTARTNRRLNVGLIGAAIVVIALCAWTSVGLRSQRDALAQSQREGSDPLLYLSTARILALRSMSDENLDLIERPNNVARADFDARTESITGGEGRPGLLDQAAARAANSETAQRIAEIDRLHQEFLAAHQRVRGLAADYDYKTAISVASSEEADASVKLDDAFEHEIAADQASLKTHARTAAHELRPLPYAVVLAAFAAIAAVAAGMWPRLREYR